MPTQRELPTELLQLANTQLHALTGTQIRGVLGERGLQRATAEGRLIKLWQGAYAPPSPSQSQSQSQSAAHRPPAALLASAVHRVSVVSKLYGFTTDPDSRTHVIGTAPSGRPELVIHRTPPQTTTNRAHGFEVIGAAETAVRLAAGAANPPAAWLCLMPPCGPTTHRPVYLMKWRYDCTAMALGGSDH